MPIPQEISTESTRTATSWRLPAYSGNNPILPERRATRKGPGCPINPEDLWLSLKSTPHHRDPRVNLKVRCGFIPAAGQVKPQDRIGVKDLQGIHTLGGKVNATFLHGRGDKEYRLILDKIDQSAAK